MLKHCAMKLTDIPAKQYIRTVKSLPMPAFKINLFLDIFYIQKWHIKDYASYMFKIIWQESEKTVSLCVRSSEIQSKSFSVWNCEDFGYFAIYSTKDIS